MSPNPVLWLEQAMAEDPGEPCPPLAAAVTADVCVVGGGLVGLWAALEARAQGASVVLLEAESCGFGASGRNGGWMTSWWDELGKLEERFGAEHARWLAAQSTGAIDRVQEITEAEGIDCGLRRGGGLIAATAPAQRARLPAANERVRRVDAGEIRSRTGMPIALEGAELTDAAAVHPARLVRGLRRLALRRGVRVFEGTAMRELRRTSPPQVITSAGRVEAGAVAVALGAWTARLHEARRALLPVASHIVATEPIPDRLAQLGWTGGELLGDPRTLVHYAQASPDGRIVFGRGGGAFGSAGRVVGRHFADDRVLGEVEAGLRRWFPMLDDVRVSHRWGGPVDHAPGHLPWVATIADGVHYAAGFSGNGVAPSALVGRILARRALRVDDELTRCGIVGDPPGLLPPEPLRSAGGRVVRRAVHRAEAAEEQGRRADPITDRLRRLVWFTLPPGSTRVLLAVIADTHLPRGARRLPDACLGRLRAADAILHAGDLVAASVLRELEALGPPVHAVAGNVDEPALRMMLPRVRTVDADGARIAMIHDAGPAAGRLERLRRTFPDADAVVFGHSHIPLHERRDGFQIFNPGSPTDRRRQPRHTMGVATAEGGRVDFRLVGLD